jgi:carboxyl-terminal processing protease
MAPEADAYLEEALDYIQRYSVKRVRINWKEVRQEARARVSTAQTSADTYPAIRWVLSCLEDHHSFLQPPEYVKQQQMGMVTSLGILTIYPEGVVVDVAPDSPGAQAGMQVRDIIETINSEPRASLDRKSFHATLQSSPVTLTFQRSNQHEVLLSVTLQAAPYQRRMKPQGYRLETEIGYLDLPAVTSNKELSKTYATTVQQLIREMDQPSIRGWVIDLRRNTGGNMWPMVAGVGPILGDGECGSFISPEGKKTSWGYSDGSVNEWAKALISEPYSLKRPLAPTAVLTSRLTCSSGEFTTLAFRGRPETRSFGEPTAGLPTANRGKKLRDGAMLNLTVALGADRTGSVYDGPIIPDQPCESNWSLFQTEHDPVLLAALDWLRKRLD